MYERGRGIPQNEAEAVKWYRKAVEIDSSLAGAWNNLAWLHATSEHPHIKDPVRALESALKAVALTDGQNPGYLDTLGEAYYANGQFAEAIETIKKAIALAPGENYYRKQLKKFKQAKEEKPIVSIPKQQGHSVLLGVVLSARTSASTPTSAA